MTTLLEAAKAALEAIAEVVRISDRKHDAWDAVKAEIDALREAIAEAEQQEPIKKSAIDFLPHDDNLRFVQRVLESSAPQKDRDDAARMVSDMRRSIYTAPKVPAGWRLAPVEPTLEMIAKGWRAAGLVNHANLRHMYNVLLAAAPKEPT